MELPQNHNNPIMGRVFNLMSMAVTPYRDHLHWEQQRCCIFHHLRASSNARQHAAAVPPWAASIEESQGWCILRYLHACCNARQHSAAVPPYRGHLHGGEAKMVYLQHLGASGNARRHSATVPPYRGHIHWGAARITYLTAPARFEQCSPASRGIPAIQGPAALQSGKDNLF